MRRILPAIVLTLASASLIGMQASKAERASVWPDRAIVIDGSDTDWHDWIQPVRDSHVALGFANDGSWLYLCLVATHQQTRAQIAASRLIVWLDGEKGKKNAFGIGFPGSQARSERGDVHPGKDAPWPGAIDVLGPGKNKVRTVPLDQSGGIEVCAAVHPEVLVYELKVPLTRSDDHPFAVGVEPGQVVRATVETPEYRGPYPRSVYMPGGSIGVAVGGGRAGVAVNGVPVGPAAAYLRPLNVQTTVLLAAR